MIFGRIINTDNKFDNKLEVFLLLFNENKRKK